MKRLILAGLVVGAAALAAVAAAAARPDGAVIRNSGSTNTAPYSIKVWSNGRAEVTMGRAEASPRSFSVDPDVAKQFFTNVKAARANPGTPEHCMKSASFGTTTTVAWHGWNSPDLQCPPVSAPLQAVAANVRTIEAAANIDTGLHRVPLPREPRMIPSTAPEVSPT